MIINTTETTGISLRDQFASSAMQGLLSGLNKRTECDRVADDAYHMADAMLKAREVDDE